jgi:hypothetical protein
MVYLLDGRLVNVPFDLGSIREEGTEKVSSCGGMNTPQHSPQDDTFSVIPATACNDGVAFL